MPAIMKKKDPLGQFEQVVLTAVLDLREQAYGLAIIDRVTELADRQVSQGSVYMTLERMEDKGFVKSWLANSTPERGGNERRYFCVLALGERLLNESLATHRRMAEAAEGAWRLGRWKPSRTT
jgi:PadR family transcriptional regulator, regulatory protein PadR